MTGKKLPKSFYQARAEELAPHLLGKYLVHSTAQGKISGMIVEVEAYTATKDEACHGKKRTPRTEVLYREGGYAYVYLIYGLHHLFSVVVGPEEIPEAVFVRAAVPEEGIDLMKRNFGRAVDHIHVLSKSPGNLCKSFAITEAHDGVDLTGETLFLEDRGAQIPDARIKTDVRVGINPKLAGSERKLRFFVDTTAPNTP